MLARYGANVLIPFSDADSLLLDSGPVSEQSDTLHACIPVHCSNQGSSIVIQAGFNTDINKGT